MTHASIWHNSETPGYDKGKAHTSFSKWRLLVVERLVELSGMSEDDAILVLHDYGRLQQGLDYDKGLTAEQVATEIASRDA